MTHSEIRQKFVAYFQKQGHAVVPSSSLLPDDPSVLLTTAGMQQFKKYYTGEADAMKDFSSKSTASIQKCFRTSDIDEVGDETHLTFFEMVGNFSFGGYFKEPAIRYAFEFITQEIGLTIKYVTIFEGSHGVPKDEASAAVWKELGVSDIREEGIGDVFWGPTGTEGPCGPSTEIYCTNANGQDVEIWNIVFNEYYCSGSREELIAQKEGVALKPLETPGIDTGMGLERLCMIAQNAKNLFETDLFAPLIALLPTELDMRIKRIIADHGRATAILIADGVRPSNKGAGYILRRLMRRAMVYEHQHALSPEIMKSVLATVIANYSAYYPELKREEEVIMQVFQAEYDKFTKTLQRGVRELEKVAFLDAASSFKLYESFGLPYEIIKEMGGTRANDLTREDFEEEFRKHQEISRQGQEKKFGGHGLILDTGELKAGTEEELAIVTRLHTATHLLQQALREVLGNEIHQMGSDITAERLRFDFNFDRKMTDEEIAKVEKRVNEWSMMHLPMQYAEMPLEEAKKTGALYFFKEKYPETVKVYFAGQSLEAAVSKEFCGGPHVDNTARVGIFHIVKEESCGAGVRRIRATVE